MLTSFILFLWQILIFSCIDRSYLGLSLANPKYSTKILPLCIAQSALWLVVGYFALRVWDILCFASQVSIRASETESQMWPSWALVLVRRYMQLSSERWGSKPAMMIALFQEPKILIATWDIFPNSRRAGVLLRITAVCLISLIIYLSYIPFSKTGLYAIFYDPANSTIAREKSLKLLDSQTIKFWWSWITGGNIKSNLKLIKPASCCRNGYILI